MVTEHLTPSKVCPVKLFSSQRLSIARKKKSDTNPRSETQAAQIRVYHSVIQMTNDGSCRNCPQNLRSAFHGPSNFSFRTSFFSICSRDTKHYNTRDFVAISGWLVSLRTKLKNGTCPPKHATFYSPRTLKFPPF